MKEYWMDAFGRHGFGRDLAGNLRLRRGTRAAVRTVVRLHEGGGNVRDTHPCTGTPVVGQCAR